MALILTEPTHCLLDELAVEPVPQGIRAAPSAHRERSLHGVANSSRLHLYVSQVVDAQRRDGHPPINASALKGMDIEGAGKLAEIVFSLAASPDFGWNESDGWLEVQLSLVQTPFSDADDLIQALPEIQKWLTEWAISALREPATSPPWALKRTIEPAVVKAIARKIVDVLAKKDARQIEFRDLQGRRVTLEVPPKAVLAAPSDARRSESTRVRKVESVHCLRLPTGQRVFAFLTVPEFSVAGVGNQIDPRNLRPITLKHGRAQTGKKLAKGKPE